MTSSAADDFSAQLIGLDTRGRHEHLLRAFALKLALDLPEGTASQILRGLNAEGTTGTAKVALLANHLLKFVVTGSFESVDTPPTSA